jgi:hypothetical protein
MSEETQRLMLVGSIPLETPPQVFDMFGSTIGRYMAAMPDGEPGHRQHWISRLHYEVFAAHPDLEVVAHPAPENGVERLHPRDARDSWRFRVKPGVEQVRFGDPGWRLGFARDAVNSYFMFRTLRDQGKLPKHLRFQVSMPFVNSELPPRLFPEPADLDRIRPGYTEALAAELDNILRLIPNEDLAIQWDCSTELQDAYGALRLPKETAIERNIGQVRALSPRIPETVLLGYHMCFGTLGGWPRFAPDDLSGVVDMANAFIAESGRRVDWMHIPCLDRTDDAFYEALADLKPQGARIYLGMVHNMGNFPERLKAARKYLSEFGVGGYCGFGRHTAAQMQTVLQDHVKAAELV